MGIPQRICCRKPSTAVPCCLLLSLLHPAAPTASGETATLLPAQRTAHIAQNGFLKSNLCLMLFSEKSPTQFSCPSPFLYCLISLSFQEVILDKFHTEKRTSGHSFFLLNFSCLFECVTCSFSPEGNVGEKTLP